MIQELKKQLEKERSKNRVLMQILEDTQKCIINGKKFLEEKPVVIAKVHDPYKRQEYQE